MKILKGKSGRIGLKLDMSKSYDIIENNFLSNVLHSMGFSTKWIANVMKMRYYGFLFYVIKLPPLPYFSPHREFKQGDPYLITFLSFVRMFSMVYSLEPKKRSSP